MQRVRVLRSLELASKALIGSWTSFEKPSTSMQRWLWSSAAVRHPVVEFPLAQTGEGIAECEVIKWLVKEGDHVEPFQKVCEVQSDKASIEITSRYKGVVTSLQHQPGDVVKVGSTLMKIDVEGEMPTEAVQEAAESTESAVDKEREGKERVLASPPVRLLAKNSGVDLSAVRPTGPENRILKEDVLNFITGSKSEQEIPSAAKRMTENRIQIRGFRRAMLKHMTAALSIPHFHFNDDVDMQSLFALRAHLAEEPQLRQLKLTVLPILMKALSAALTEFPVINSSLSEDQQELVLHADHNIGVAVATDEGLVVPVVKRVQEKTIVQIALELEELKKDALGNTCKPSDLADGTISISNVGTLGGLYATPLITPPQTAIVALGRIRSVMQTDKDIKDLNDIRLRPMMPISWGADHRVLDGAALVQFSNRWKQFIEQPGRLLLFLK